MIEIKIVNKIEEKINEYIESNGSTKTWIANKGGMTKQALYTVMKSKNPTIEVMHRIAYVLNCDIKDLYEVEIINL